MPGAKKIMVNEYQSTYSPNTPKIKKQMLSDIGVDSYKNLFSDIPEKYRFPELNYRLLLQN